MNFRPTKWKLLISILVVIFWIMINYFALSDINCKMTEYRACEMTDYDNLMIIKPACDNQCQTLGDAVWSDILNIFLPFLLVYTVWSLFQKSK